MICRYKHLLLVRRGRLVRREQVAAQNVQIERFAEVLGLVLVDEEHQVARLGLGLGRGLDVSDDDRVAPVLLALQVCSQPSLPLIFWKKRVKPNLISSSRHSRSYTNFENCGMVSPLSRWNKSQLSKSKVEMESLTLRVKSSLNLASSRNRIAAVSATDVVEQDRVDALLVAQDLADGLRRVRFLLELLAHLVSLAELVW